MSVAFQNACAEAHVENAVKLIPKPSGTRTTIDMIAATGVATCRVAGPIALEGNTTGRILKEMESWRDDHLTDVEA